MSPVDWKKERFDAPALHGSLWTKLCALGRRMDKGPEEIVLHGPLGVGKSYLLRRYYWELFNRQDAELPLFCSFGPAGFRPAQWARRFLQEAALQWVAFERRQPSLVRSAPPALPTLTEWCYDVHLHPLAEGLRQMEALEAEGRDGSFLVEWIFETLESAGQRLNQRLTLLLDAPENACWRERGQEYWLSRVCPPLEKNSCLRRIWTSRNSGRETHPFLTPDPLDVERWELGPLSLSQAESFFEELARQENLDYDEKIIQDFLPLWGQLPRWMVNFVRHAAHFPRPVAAADSLIQPYINDIMEGPSARDLEEALQVAVPQEPYDPAQVGRAARIHLLGDQFSPSESETAQADGIALRRLARSGLAVYRQGHWEMADTPLMQDFLQLFMARHNRSENLARCAVTLRRKRLVETPRRLDLMEADQKLKHLSLLLHTFRGQEVPRGLFQCHLPGPTEGHANFMDALNGETLAGERIDPEQSLSLPYCIGAFSQEHAAGLQRNLPTVVGWCFDGPECLRSEEKIWVAYSLNVRTVTSEELDLIEEANNRIGRELEVGRLTAWIITQGQFSLEAIDRVREKDWVVSDWRACEKLGEIVLRKPLNRGNRPSREEEKRIHDEAKAWVRQRVETVRQEDETVGEESPTSDRPAARIMEGSPSNRGKVVEMALTPESDMELAAAGTVEQMAKAGGFDEMAVGQLKMAVLEGCLNAIERSRNAEKMVHVRLECGPERFKAVIENEGETFDPQKVEEPVLEEKFGQAYKRGWGLKLMRKFMDKVVFEPYEGGTRLRLEKLKKDPEPPLKEAEAN